MENKIQREMHNVVLDQILMSDDSAKPFIVYSGKKGEPFARVYKQEGLWQLVSNPDYRGGGLIVFIEQKIVEEIKVGMCIKVRNVLPNVVFGEIVNGDNPAQ